MLKLNTADMQETAVDGFTIKTATITAHQTAGEHVRQTVIANLQAKQYGYANLLEDKQYLPQVQRVFSHISWADTLVVIGIGGSDLGGRAIYNAMHRPDAQMRVIFHGDTTDPNDIDDLLREIELSHTVFNIVSKSGGTMETMAFYLYFKQLYAEREEDWSKHFVFTTDQGSPLWNEALHNGIAMLKIPSDIGGRYSVFSAVGMLPALAMEVDIESIWHGASAALREELSDGEQAVAWQIAWNQFLLKQQGVDAAIFMPYSRKLEEFGRWIRQLYAESLGKDGNGILPIQARGPADQHSQLQFYTQGKFLASVLFLRVEDHGVSYVIDKADLPDNEYLQGKEFADIINIEQEATALSLRKVGRPSATLEIERIDAAALGELFMTFMLTVTYLGELLGVNAFDQPGVEESKNFMYALLGKSGYEAKRDEIAKLSGE